MTAGRPIKYNPEICERVTQFCLMGATDIELAEFIDISTETLHRWKKLYPEFSSSIKEGKELADARISDALYQKALAGDSTAMIFWLKNRRSKHWRDKQDLELAGKDGSPLFGGLAELYEKINRK